MTTLIQLENDLIESLNDERADILLSDYPEDRLMEMIDSTIPVYYSQLAQCLADDTSLASVDDEGLVEGMNDVYKIIQTAIYERLSATAYDWLHEAQQEEEMA